MAIGFPGFVIDDLTIHQVPPLVLAPFALRGFEMGAGLILVSVAPTFCPLCAEA